MEPVEDKDILCTHTDQDGDFFTIYADGTYNIRGRYFPTEDRFTSEWKIIEGVFHYRHEESKKRYFEPDTEEDTKILVDKILAELEMRKILEK